MGRKIASVRNLLGGEKFSRKTLFKTSMDCEKKYRETLCDHKVTNTPVKSNKLPEIFYLRVGNWKKPGKSRERESVGGKKFLSNCLLYPSIKRESL